jgi:hypothetical protein
MSILKLELTENHIKLLKYFKCDLNDNTITLSIAEEDEVIKIIDQDKYEYVDLVLNGKPDEFSPFTTEEIVGYSEEQKKEWDKLFSELPLALSIILHNGSFDLGTYKTKFHDRVWKKIK